MRIATNKCLVNGPMPIAKNQLAALVEVQLIMPNKDRLSDIIEGLTNVINTLIY